MLLKEFTQEIEKTYNKYFPNSKCFVRLSKNLYHSISIACYLANDKKELSGGYWENDMFSIRFSIDTNKGEFSRELNEESTVPENLRLEANAKSYNTKPSVPYMAYDRKQISFRKTTGDSKKILNSLDKFFSKLHSELVSELGKELIHNSHSELLTTKLINKIQTIAAK